MKNQVENNIGDEIETVLGALGLRLGLYRGLHGLSYCYDPSVANIEVGVT